METKSTVVVVYNDGNDEQVLLLRTNHLFDPPVPEGGMLGAVIQLAYPEDHIFVAMDNLDGLAPVIMLGSQYGDTPAEGWVKIEAQEIEDEEE